MNQFFQGMQIHQIQFNSGFAPDLYAELQLPQLTNRGPDAAAPGADRSLQPSESMGTDIYLHTVQYVESFLQAA